MIYRPFLHDGLLVKVDFRNWIVSLAWGVLAPEGHTANEAIPNTSICLCKSLKDAQKICDALNRNLDGDQSDG